MRRFLKDRLSKDKYVDIPTMLLNCDLGESFGAWSMGVDDRVMPYIDQANIACGFHAGDPVVMRRTLSLAKQYGVAIGAHPAYPDLVGFGRRSMLCSDEEIIALMHYQIGALDGAAQSLGLSVDYVKPHGALYNDMMAKPAVRQAVLTAMSTYHRPLPLMLQATGQASAHRMEAKEKSVTLWFEAFADRAYGDDGQLLSRNLPGAVLGREKALAQAEQLCSQGTVTTINGLTLALEADSLCVHGDNPEGVQVISAIRDIVSG